MAIEVNGYTIQPGADLSGADLSGADLSNMDLSQIDFRGANLTNANLSGSNLHYSDFDYYTDLSGADLSNISVYGDGTAGGIPSVSYANFNRGDFSNVADLSGADFTGVFLTGTRFEGLDLTGVNFKSATLEDASFGNSNLSGADFGSALVTNVNWSGATVNGANFYNAVYVSEKPVSIENGYMDLYGSVGSYVMDEDFSVANTSISFDEVTGSSDSEVLEGSDGNDVISGGDGSDLILAGAGDDTIIVGGSQTFSSSYKAVNTSSATQVGTRDKVTLEGMLRVEDVIDGGADTDTIELGEGNVALFLHDAFSGFHSSVQLSSDSTGEQSKARLENIEKITGNDSDVNIIDLTSSDYSLAGQTITVDGAGGRDIIWGSDANETIKGGDGDDELFGGAGTNVLTGGAGADEFQFTMTSTNDGVTDFNAAEGDTLKFFNTGGATFNRDSVTANSEGDGISIEYSHNDQVQSLNISLGLSSSSVTNDLLSAIEII